jgi:hypothetical protein
MNNVVSLRRRNVWRKFADNVRQNSDPAFCTGLGAAFVLPWAICSSYFGFPFAIALGACASVGTISGIVAYRSFAYRIITCVPEIVRQAPASCEYRIPMAA